MKRRCTYAQEDEHREAGAKSARRWIKERGAEWTLAHLTRLRSVPEVCPFLGNAYLRGYEDALAATAAEGEGEG